ncbi:DUF4267 domain-containing protein [Aspergillus undulatus]|uniref:DUF4267 domain-containing protein n=1 Tax=Aspergillus undulatus TaxID=1810928 RepID=UPI003CCCB51D
MFPHFALHHIPPLFVATATTLGGLTPFFNAERAIKEFGLPEHIAVSKPAQSAWILKCGRITTLGLALWTFYAQGKLAEFDTILAIMGYVGLVDGVCLLEGGSSRKGCVSVGVGAAYLGVGVCCVDG